MEVDDRTFGVDFSNEGVTTLRECVKEKLKEFMGDYTDDTLVEYVIVLLKNGRRKDEAKSELNVFLGDDSDSFVSWLWDHLGSNLSLYVQPPGLHPDGAPKTKSAAGKQIGRTELHNIVSEAEKGNSDRTSANRLNQEWKGLVRDGDENVVPLPRNSMADIVPLQNEPRRRSDRTKQSLSPRPTIQKKRRRTEERGPRKREVSQETVSAPRRLLQFAVRDAVGTSRPSNSTAEPSLKRLRSVVSTSTEDASLEERPRRIRQVAGMRTDMSAAIKAVADAVKDASKIRSSRNVFDRLGHAIASNITIHQEQYRVVSEDGVGEDFVNEREDFHSTYHPQNDSSMQQEGNVSSFDDDTVIASDFGYEGEGYDVNVMGQGAADRSWSVSSGGNWAENSLKFQNVSAEDAEERAHRLRKELDRPTVAPSTSVKMASSRNLNTWKPPQYQEVREGSGMNNLKMLGDTLATKSEEWLTKKHSNPLVAFNGNVKPGVASQHEPQKTHTPSGLYSMGAPTEDADSRTVFVSNVHFAATKDSLSRHFNKFGEVLKVNILTDPATGQPKGSAYIEFMRKEAAEHALSLDGTSFMSRILKIVRKSSAQPETASAMTWPRAARASPFAVPRFGRVPFARGIPSLYRARIPVKPGARSFQWKRESTVTVTSNQASNSAVLPSTTRSLTYVRTGPKTNGSSDTA